MAGTILTDSLGAAYARLSKIHTTSRIAVQHGNRALKARCIHMTSPASTDQASRTSVCRSLLVVGGGVMGQGIARLFASAGIRVTLVDTREIAFSHPGVTTARLLPPEMLPDLVIEAVFEDLKVKQSVYADVEAAYGGRPALATNTSGLPLDELAAPLRHPARFLAMHFFQPADVFPMIEVVRGTRTEDAAVGMAVAAVTQARRDPILLAARRSTDI